jgi:hypothetical protein
VVADTSVASSPAKVTAFKTFVPFCSFIFLSKAKINSKDHISLLSCTHQEIFWLDIPVDKGLRMDVFDLRNKLVS